MTRIGVDVGGTFTDVVVIDDEDRIHTSKTPSTPDKPDSAVIAALERAESEGVSVTKTSFLAHGTTVTTNAVLEYDLPETALVTTSGFGDVLEIGRQNRSELYDLDVERADPIVPRDRRFTVEERIGPDGEIVTDLDPEAVETVAEAIPDSVESVAVATLFSFRNPRHERQIGRALDAESAAEYVSLSSAVLPEFREYERTSTTVMNAALIPVIERYLARLGENTRALGIDEEWVVMQSNGGLMSPKSAQRRPVTTLLSGPAAGVTGAQYLAEAAGFENVITMDMGGTSTDVSLVDGGEPTVTTDWTIGEHPISVPAIDIHTIGAGGGSIAWIDAGGALRVGPKSAGAEPGPAAYGRGGDRPTVTDAHVVLGRIHPDFPLGGELSVDVDAARAAIESEIADPLGQSVRESALGILAVARSNMERAVRVVSVERGYDPREFVLVAFGGAGPLHATDLAEELSIPTVMVPRVAGVLSGLGLLTADRIHTFVDSVIDTLESVDRTTLCDRFDRLVSEGRETLREEGIEPERRVFQRSLDLRYAGQSYSLSVPVEEDVLQRDGFEDVLESFHRIHDARYGHANPAEPVELVNVRVVARGLIPSVDVTRPETGSLEDARIGSREVQFRDGDRETTIYDHDSLPPDASFDGPAIVQASAATTVVHPGQTLDVDERGSLLVRTGVGDS